MNASRKNPPSYWGIALRFIALLPKFPSRNKCVRSIFLGFLLLLAMPAHAASTIAGSKLWCNGLIGGCTYSSDTAAAQATYDTFNSWYSKGCGNLGDVRTCIWTITGCDGIGHCTGTASVYAGGTLLQTTDFRYWPYSVTTCPDHSTTNGTDCTCNNGYEPDPTNTQCVVQSCPPNSSGTYPDACTCDKDYEPDPTKTSCVSTCSVPRLTPLDPAYQPYEDGLADMENETQATRDGAACIVRTARARHLSPQLISGYRPQAYQTHIREVYDKWQLLVNNNDPVCAETKRQVGIEFKRHSKFAHQPGNTSRHSSGLAVDIHLSDYTDADTIATGCAVTGGGSMSRPVANDRSHFESPR
jgi:hypothetical protein